MLPQCQLFTFIPQPLLGMDVMVKLRAGRPVKSDAKSEPLRNQACGREDCMCCSTGNPGRCERNGIGYRISCEGCQRAGVVAEYEGESGRNAYSRGLEHQQGLRDECEKSALWKQCQLVHGGNKQSFLMVALNSFKSCLERQINEAVRITSSKAELVLNSKTEFHQAPIRRMVTTAGLQALQGEEEGWVPVRAARGAGATARGATRVTRETPATRAARGDRGRGRSSRQRGVRPRGD